MKKIIFTLLCLTLLTQLVLACPLHGKDGGAKGDEGSSTGQADE